jgi:hypothetical protein
VFVQIVNYFLFCTSPHQLPSCLGQRVLKLCKNTWDNVSVFLCFQNNKIKGQRVLKLFKNRWDNVSVFLCFQNNKIKVMVTNKCYDNFEYISIMNLQSTV